MGMDEFLAWEERQERRYEFDGFAPVAMAGGTSEHALIQIDLTTALRTRRRGVPCRAYGSELKIMAAGSIRYPDAFVVCSPVPRGTMVITEPVVVFEIVSPSSSSVDRIVKVREYGNPPSIQRYVILEQTSQAATVFTHLNGHWAGEVFDGDIALEMPEIGISLPLTELFVDVEFPPKEEGEA